MNDSHYYTRLLPIASTVSEGRGLIVFGDVPEQILDGLRRYGPTVSRTTSPTAGETVISFDYADKLDGAGMASFFDQTEGAAAIVAFGRDRCRKASFETAAFERGYRVHPAYFTHVDYEDEFHDGYWSILQALDPAASAKYNIDWLLENRSLHMDMTRESGLRSDAHMIRYVYASRFIRPGDAVIDCACGLGYGSNIMRTVSDCASVIGRDLSERAVAYAKDNFTQHGIGYEVGDAQDLSAHDNQSFDTFVSFETLEHVPEPERVIAEAYRVLKPGGRFIASVPFDWSDETGEDPNPYHLHVYTKQKLIDQITRHFRIEELAIQNAGGGYKLPNNRKAIFSIGPDGEQDGEWLLVVAYKDPLSARIGDFEDTIYPYPNPTTNFLSFSRDYENPVLMRSLFGVGVRITSASERLNVASRVVEEASPTSPDAGAALCVIGYQLLNSGTEHQVKDFLARASSYAGGTHTSAHARRWATSLAFLIGIFNQRQENRTAALSAYDAVIASDWLAFSPTLGTKAAEAAYRAGMIAIQSGDVAKARLYWSKGLDAGKSVMRADWKEVVGDESCPLPDAMRETVQVLDIARRCADCLRMTSEHEYRSSYARWRWMVDDREMAETRDLAITQSASAAMRDAGKWRSLRARLYANKLISTAIRAVRRIRRG